MTENEAIRDLEYLIEEYSAYPPETGVNETIGSLQYCITALREIQQYRAIGTVEECRECAGDCRDGGRGIMILTFILGLIGGAAAGIVVMALVEMAKDREE